MDRVVPIAMERVAREADASQLLVGDLDPTSVVPAIDLAPYSEPGRRGGRRDQADDGGVRQQRLASPVLGDEGEEAVLDLVPLAGPRRQMAHRDREPRLVR